MQLNLKLRKLMDDRRLSVSDVATHCGISTTTVMRWRDLHEPVYPRLNEALALARLLDVPIEFLADDAQDAPDPGLSPDEQQILAVVREINDPGAVLRRLFSSASGPTMSATR